MPPSNPNSNLHMCQCVFVVPLIPPCPHVRGANLTIPARLCAQEASLSSTLSIPNGRRRLWQVQVRPAPRSVWCGRLPSHAAHNCLRAAGPRATLSRAADDPGLLGHLLFVNFLIVPVSLLAHLVCRVKVSGSVSWSSRIVTVNEWWKELVIFVRIDVSVCHSC